EVPQVTAWRPEGLSGVGRDVDGAHPFSIRESGASVTDTAQGPAPHEAGSGALAVQDPTTGETKGVRATPSPTAAHTAALAVSTAGGPQVPLGGAQAHPAHVAGSCTGSACPSYSRCGASGGHGGSVPGAPIHRSSGFDQSSGEGGTHGPA